MKNEIYYWIALFVVIIAVAAYFRFYYQPQYSITLSVNRSGLNLSAVYPYQTLHFPVTVNNEGSNPVTNLTVGVFVNGNLTDVYKVTLPGDKEAYFIYNTTQTVPGPVNISIIADPGRLYNIANRAAAASGVDYVVQAPAVAAPQDYLPAGNVTTQRRSSEDAASLGLDLYLYNYYNVSQLRLTGSPYVQPYLYTTLTTLYNLTKNASVASATYANGTSITSFWLEGTLNTTYMQASDILQHVPYNYTSTGLGEVLVSKISNDTTACSWYAQGWEKSVIYYGNATCTSVLSLSQKVQQAHGLFSALPLFEERPLANLTLNIGNLSVATYLLVSKPELTNSSSFLYESVALNASPTNACADVISTYNGVSYCNIYVVPNSGLVGPDSLVETVLVKGADELVGYSLSNTTLLRAQVYTNEFALSQINVTGFPVTFQSGSVDFCAFPNAFLCANQTFFNNTLSFSVKNLLASSVTFRNISCFTAGFGQLEKLNVTVASNATAELSTPCYFEGTRLTGFQPNLHYGVPLNYTVNGQANMTFGNGFVSGFG